MKKALNIIWSILLTLIILANLWMLYRVGLCTSENLDVIIFYGVIVQNEILIILLCMLYPKRGENKNDKK